MRIHEIKYEIPIKEEINIKIVHISDIHFYLNYNLHRLYKIKEKIKQINPNYICITGDLIDEYRVVENNYINYLTNWIKDLSNISKVIITLGNHDIIKKEKNKYIEYKEISWLKKITNKNIILLDNDIYIEGKIKFIGFNPEYKHYYEDKEKNNDITNKSIEKLLTKNNYYNILLIHTPNVINDTWRINKWKNQKD